MAAVESATGRADRLKLDPAGFAQKLVDASLRDHAVGDDGIEVFAPSSLESWTLAVSSETS
jgi:hypothetical protein